jgi:methionyl-tRNA synthetase
MLGYEGVVHDRKWDEALVGPPPGQKFKDIKPLFQKLEPERQVDLAPSEETKEAQTEESFDTESLIEVDLGDERRTLVAGLKQHYRPEELEGRNIAVLCNLKPAKLRGVESKGMLLAAESDGVVGVLYSDTAEPGDVVTGGKSTSEISFDEFQKFRLEVAGPDKAGGAKSACLRLEDGKNITLIAKGKPLMIDKDVKEGSRIR